MTAYLAERPVLQQLEHAVSETVADECIIINLANGNYHRTLGLSSKLWEELRDPTSFEAWLTSARARDPEVQPAALAQFGLSLIDGDLASAAPETVAVLKSVVEEGAPGGPVLELETYDDMADLLLLDPIHEVNEHGWPSRPPATE